MPFNVVYEACAFKDAENFSGEIAETFRHEVGVESVIDECEFRVGVICEDRAIFKFEPSGFASSSAYLSYISVHDVLALEGSVKKSVFFVEYFYWKPLRTETAIYSNLLCHYLYILY